MSNGTVWTPLMEKRLEKLVDIGTPYKMIAELLSAEFSVYLTKNSCIGKGRRLQVPLRLAPRKRQCQPRRKRRSPLSVERRKPAVKKKKRKPAAPAQPDLAPATTDELPVPAGGTTQSAI